MGQTRTDQEIADLRRRVQQRLDERCRDLGFHLVVSAELEEGQWVTFVVTPDQGEVRAYDYAEALVAVEAEVRREEGEERLLLVPAIPG